MSRQLTIKVLIPQTHRSGSLGFLAGNDVHGVPVSDSRLLQVQLRLQQAPLEQNGLQSGQKPLRRRKGRFGFKIKEAFWFQQLTEGETHTHNKQHKCLELGFESEEAFSFQQLTEGEKHADAL